MTAQERIDHGYYYGQGYEKSKPYRRLWLIASALLFLLGALLLSQGVWGLVFGCVLAWSGSKAFIAFRNAYDYEMVRVPYDDDQLASELSKEHGRVLQALKVAVALDKYMVCLQTPEKLLISTWAPQWQLPIPGREHHAWFSTTLGLSGRSITIRTEHCHLVAAELDTYREAKLFDEAKAAVKAGIQQLKHDLDDLR